VAARGRVMASTRRFRSQVEDWWSLVNETLIPWVPAGTGTAEV
jgi:hypothetical protein